MRRILPPGDAPPYITRLVRDIERALGEPPDTPVKVPSFADAAALPSASRWIYGIVHVADINQLAFSDGTNWYPLTKGAAL
jgi:hypothetical protein